MSPSSGPAEVDLTVVIPAFDAQDVIGDQLDALLAQQPDCTWEIVVVDNGSSDATASVVTERMGASSRLTLVSAVERRGPSFARNVGAAAARGRGLAFCDADDIVGAEWVGAVAAALATDSFVTGPVDLTRLNEPWAQAARGTGGSAGAARFDDRFPFASSCNVGIDRELFERLGGFDEELTVGEDIDLSMRAYLAGVELRFVDGARIDYRLRSTSAATFRQAFAYGVSRPVLAERWRRRGGAPPVARTLGLRNWGWLVRHLPMVVRRADRGHWLWVAGLRLGNLRGSVRVRRLYL
jgi:glycosyltransferase involved in cell wall biosynthesis